MSGFTVKERAAAHGFVVGAVVPGSLPPTYERGVCEDCAASTVFARRDLAAAPLAVRVCTDCALPWLTGGAR